MTNSNKLSTAMGTSYKDLFKLYDVIQNGNERMLEDLLKETPVQINQIIPCRGIGLLHLAVGIEPEEKSKRCTEILLKHGADPNLCNEEGVTPVHIAAIWGRAGGLRLLLGCGGDAARRDRDGLCAFDYAAQHQQWAAFDYLHRVVDDTDHDLQPQCAYTLQLERVLLTTDELVAEYGPIVDDTAPEHPAVRKSELINVWCDKNSLCINKLYPTILGDTYSVDEDPSWRSATIPLPDLTLDLTSHTHHDSFKSCFSTNPNEVQISGVHPIDITLDETKENSNVLNKRISVYENFSLPGSPNTISHINYNSKTSLKKKRAGLISKEFAQELDRVLAVVQNRTNELLSASHTEVGGGGRARGTLGSRGSASSSGVSTAGSGSIAVASVHHQYKYEDKQEDVVLLETRLRLSPVVLSVEDEGECVSGSHSVVSVASSLPPAVRVDDATLRLELQRLGFEPGPILDTTRHLYLKKLHALKKQAHTDPVEQLTDQLNGLNVDNKPRKKTYSIEMEKSLRSAEWMDSLGKFADMEHEARAEFAEPGRRWREGGARTSFTYLLLDPRLTRDLPRRADGLDRHTTWKTFVDAIFYVGKGKRSRPYSHLYQALTLWKKDFTTSKDKKVQHILDIWRERGGVVCLHVFQNVVPAHALTLEAAMIDALGLGALDNIRPGTYYGLAASWPLKERRRFGVYLLYKAMLIFLSEGETQLRPHDLD